MLVDAEAKKKFLAKLESCKYDIEVLRHCRCGSNEIEKITGYDRDGFKFGSYICPQCGLVQTCPRLSPLAAESFYQKDYYKLYYSQNHDCFFNKYFFHNYQPYQGILIYNYIKEFITKDPLYVVEIGCGSGMNLYQFIKCSRNDQRRVYAKGVDYSSAMAAEAWRVFRVPVVSGGIEKLNELGLKADIIILSHVLEHVLDLDLFLQQANQHLAENGLVYVEVPGILDLKQRFIYNYGRYYFHFPHTYCFCLDTLKTVMAENGFAFIKGNEWVKAVFRKQPLKYHHSGDNAYDRIHSYLKDLLQPPFEILSAAIASGSSGETGRAILLTQQCLNEKPEWDQALMYMARMAVGIEDWNKAADYALRALTTGIREQHEAMMLVAQCNVKLKQFDRALQYLDVCQRIEPWNMQPKIIKARIWHEQKKNVQALSELYQIEEISTYELDAKYTEGLVLMELNRFSQALKTFAHLERLQPEMAVIKVQLAKCLDNIGEYENALRKIRQAKKLAVGSADIWLEEARLLKELGRMDEALELIEQLQIMQPSNPSVSRMLGGLLAVAGRINEAVCIFLSILRENPEKAEIWLNISDALRYAGRYREARAAAEKFNERRPDSVQGWITLGKIYEAARDFNHARDCFRKAHVKNKKYAGDCNECKL